MKQLKNRLTKRTVFYVSIITGVMVVVGFWFVFRWDITNPTHRQIITVDSLKRVFHYYVPRGLGKKTTLIFVVHGSGMNASKMQLITGRVFDKLSDLNHNSIIVYPEAWDGRWGDCRNSGGSTTSPDHELNFFKEMIRFFSEQNEIDKDRIFMMGYSGGGQLAYRFALENPELFKGFAVVSASLPAEGSNRCHESGQPVSMLVMAGTSDPFNPYAGGIQRVEGKERGVVLSVEASLACWLRLCAIDSAVKTISPYPDISQRDNSEAVRYDYGDQGQPKTIVLVKIVNGGHTIPNPVFFLWPEKLGNVNKDINAPAIIYRYFQTLK